MVPKDSTLTDYYITRKVYLEQDPDTPHLKMWAGKTHYMEWIGGQEPKPTCSCCEKTRKEKPTENEIINSTETNFDIKYNDLRLQFNSTHMTLSLINGSQIPSYITYYPKENKISFSWKHWVHSDNSLCFYATFYKGKFFEKEKSYNRLKYYYPEWVTNDTIWYGQSGIQSGSDMFPELNKNEFELTNKIDNNIDNMKIDHQSHLYYTDCATNAVNLTSNKVVSELFDLVIDLWNELEQFIPGDIKGNRYKKSDSESNDDKPFDITKTIKYSGLEDLDLLRNELIEYFESLDRDDNINKLGLTMRNFTPSLIPELVNKIYSTSPSIENLISMYPKPVSNSPNVLIYSLCDYPEKKTWIGKTIVNNTLVNIIKEVHIQNEQIKSIPKGRFIINGMEQKSESIDTNTNIIVDNSEEADEIAFKLVEDLVKKTWPDKNIIRYDKSDSQISKSKYIKKEKQPIDFLIKSWIREKDNN